MDTSTGRPWGGSGNRGASSVNAEPDYSIRRDPLLEAMLQYLSEHIILTGVIVAALVIFRTLSEFLVPGFLTSFVVSALAVVGFGAVMWKRTAMLEVCSLLRMATLEGERRCQAEMFCSNHALRLLWGICVREDRRD